VRRDGLVARRLDDQMKVVERALDGIVRRPAHVEVEELPTRAEVVILAVLAVRPVDVDVAVPPRDRRAERVLVERARDGDTRSAVHQRGDRDDAGAQRHAHGEMNGGSVWEPWMLVWQRVQSR